MVHTCGLQCIQLTIDDIYNLKLNDERVELSVFINMLSVVPLSRGSERKCEDPIFLPDQEKANDKSPTSLFQQRKGQTR